MFNQIENRVGECTKPRGTTISSACETIMSQQQKIMSLLKELENKISPALKNVPEEKTGAVQAHRPATCILDELLRNFEVGNEEIAYRIMNIAGRVEL